MRLVGCACLLALLALAGCTQPITSTATPAASTERAVPSSSGTILSIRKVNAPKDSVAWRAALLADASGATGTGNTDDADLTEFIVRTESGATISVVQTNELKLRPGDRVSILRDGHTRLARPG